MCCCSICSQCADVVLSRIFCAVALTRYIFIRRTCSDRQRDRLYFFNSFFYKAVGPRRDFAKVQRWTKGVTIFDKDFLLFPIHEAYVSPVVPWVLLLGGVRAGAGADAGGRPGWSQVYLDESLCEFSLACALCLLRSELGVTLWLVVGADCIGVLRLFVTPA